MDPVGARAPGQRPVVELSAVTAPRDDDEALLSLRLRLAPDPDPGAAGLAGADNIPFQFASSE